MKNRLTLTMLCFLLLICCAFSLASCNEEPEEHVHQFGAWVEEVKATCTDDGVRGHKSCVSCGKNFDKDGKEITSLVIDSIGGTHTYTNDYDITCDKCGATNPVTSITETDLLVTIKFADGKVLRVEKGVCSHTSAKSTYEIIPHTQTKKGTYVSVCGNEDCNIVKIYEDSVCVMSESKLVLDPGKNICEDGAIKLNQCAICQKTVTVVIPAKVASGDDGQHTVTEWTETVAPQHGIVGEKEGYCTNPGCGKLVKAEIPALHYFKYTLAVDGAGTGSEIYTLVAECDRDNCAEHYENELEATKVTRKVITAVSCDQEGKIEYTTNAPDTTLVTCVVTLEKLNHIYNGDRLVSDENTKYDIDKYQELALWAEGAVVCNVDKVKTYFSCDDCGSTIPVWVYKQHTVSDASWSITEPTCTVEGKKEGYCEISGCGKLVTEPIAALGHDYKYEIVSTVVNDEESYTLIGSCQRNSCGDKTNPIPVDAKDVSKVIIEPTCTKEGSITYTYNKLNEETGERIVATTVIVLEKTAHTLNGKEMNNDENTPYVIDEHPGIKAFIGSAFTCKNAIDAHFTCDGCGDTVKVKARAMHAVNSSWKVTTPATCLTGGVKSGACVNCGNDAATETIKATGHSYTYNYDEASSTLQCVCTGANCTEYNYTLTEVSVSITKAPTCAALGKKLYTGKNASGETVSVSDVIAKLDHTLPSIQPNANGHYPITDGVITLFAGEVLSCDQTAEGYYVCSGCGQKKNVTVYQPHILAEGSKLVSPATCETEGVREGMCILCDTNVRVNIPAVGHNFVFEITLLPTAATTGKAIGKCSHNCDKQTEEIVLPVLSDDAYITAVTLPATCAANGTLKYTLNGETAEGYEYSLSFEVDIAATGHSRCECSTTDHDECTDNLITFVVTETFYDDKNVDEEGNPKMYTASVTYTIYECKNVGCNLNILLTKSYVYNGIEYTYDAETNVWSEVEIK